MLAPSTPGFSHPRPGSRSVHAPRDICSILRASFQQGTAKVPGRFCPPPKKPRIVADFPSRLGRVPSSRATPSLWAKLYFLSTCSANTISLPVGPIWHAPDAMPRSCSHVLKRLQDEEADHQELVGRECHLSATKTPMNMDHSGSSQERLALISPGQGRPY